jgi:hypothetical protein
MHSTAPLIAVTVYRITGRQGPINIPHRFCEECDLTIHVVQQVIADLDEPHVAMTVRPWLLWFWKPLLRGGWHAPIVTVNHRIISQGVVPSPETVRSAILATRVALQTTADIEDRVRIT